MACISFASACLSCLFQLPTFPSSTVLPLAFAFTLGLDSNHRSQAESWKILATLDQWRSEVEARCIWRPRASYLDSSEALVGCYTTSLNNNTYIKTLLHISFEGKRKEATKFCSPSLFRTTPVGNRGFVCDSSTGLLCIFYVRDGSTLHFVQTPISDVLLMIRLRGGTCQPRLAALRHAKYELNP